MITYSADVIAAMERRFRANMINGLSGAKSANLIGTISEGGDENLALFSSVVHLGAHPPLLGFIVRPVHVERHTYENIIATKCFSVNAVCTAFQQNAHHTSARFPRDVSEFAACGLNPFYASEFKAPFVAESPLHLGCTLEEDIPINANATRLIVGRIQLIRVKPALQRPDGSLEFNEAQLAAITGLDAWHALGPAQRYSYAKPDTPPEPLQP